ncbi:MAG: nucleoside-diphosphate sugar epimerase/dehydratase [Saprospiraceae bacterium]
MKFSAKHNILGTGPVAGYVTKLLVLASDMVFALFSFTFALLLTDHFQWERINLLTTWAPIALLLLRGVAFVWFRTYLLIIRYVGEKDYLNVFLAISTSSFLFLLLVYFIPSSLAREDLLPIVLVDYFILLFLSGGFRILLRLLFDKLRMQSVSRLNTVIFGAGELGAMIERVLKHNTSHNYKVVAYFDDNERVHKKYLNGIRIFNPGKSFADIIRKFNIKYAIIGINDLPEERRLRFIENCLENQVHVLKVPPTERWLNDTLQVGQLVEINFEDLLNRPPIQLDQKGIEAGIRGKVVMVTGCAGSIGSEIVRQLLPYQPSLLIGVDQAETPLHGIGLQLKEAVEQGVFKPMIGDVKDRAVMQQFFEQYRPAYVFHAAAYKHVPIMEAFPSEAVRTNVYGTMNMADLAVYYGVKKFVMISTDKAVNPSNIMGASKRLAEIYVQALNGSTQNQHTQFITTRFGNVLGSNGSVIPIFKRQIEQRQPVTVTHPDVTRFFMTIPEACQLVLEAGAMGNGGEIFIFDMGEPVKIVDLARKMIQMAGLVPGEDVEIQFTGLRPGEKLYEELLDAHEGLIPTHHPKIKKAEVRENSYDEVCQNFEHLIQLAVEGKDTIALVKAMKALVPESRLVKKLLHLLPRLF